MKFLRLFTLSALVSSCGVKTTDAKQIKEFCNKPDVVLTAEDRKKYCT